MTITHSSRVNTVRRMLGLALAAFLTLIVINPSTSVAQVTPLPDPDGDGNATLVIHKHSLQARQSSSGQGLPVSGFDAATLIDDVTFRIQRISEIDLMTRAGWVQASELAEIFDDARADASIIDAGYTLTGSRKLTTGRDGQGAGQAAFTTLGYGVYLVEEIDTPAGIVSARPFVVTLPMTHPVERDQWLTTVHLYPKNEEVGATKTIDDTTAVIPGDDVSYEILADIPTMNPTDLFVIRDELPPQVQLQAGTLQVGLGDGTQWVAGAGGHYEASLTAGGFEITLTQRGRQSAYEATTAGQAEQLRVGFTATVVAEIVTGLDGEFTNQAEIFPNRSSWENNTPLRPTVDAKWGGIQVVKVDSADNSRALAGAQFELWYGPDRDFENAVPLREDQTDPSSDSQVWISDSTGELNLNPLRFSTWVGGEAVTEGDSGYRYYWLVEVRAPEGFQRLESPIGFEVNHQSVAQQIVVENVAEPPPIIGETGSTILRLAPLMGLLIIAGLIAVTISRSRVSRGGAVTAAKS